MDSLLLTVWAKRSGATGEQPSYHSLLAYMIDVASVAQTLWESVLPAAMRYSFSDALCLSEEDARRWVAYLAGLHDIGKASPAFQLQDPLARDRLSKMGLPCPRVASPEPRHGVVSTIAVQEILHRTFGVSSELSARISTVLGGHHGIFPRSIELSDAKSQPDRVGIGTWEKLRHELALALANLLAVSRNSVPSGLNNAAAMKLAGFVSVADWIGSDETHFPYSGLCQPTNIKEYGARAGRSSQEALKKLGWLQGTGFSKDARFEEIFDFKPNLLQEASITLAGELKTPSLVIIEAPMGEGKTEAA